MTNWNDVVAAVPDLAEQAKALFDAHKHKTIATVKKDGAPRISGIELDFKDGELWTGSMPGLKAQDLIRDPRFAIHSASVDPGEGGDPGDWKGDAKLSGRAIEVTDPAIKHPFGEGAPPGPFHLFKVDITEVTVVKVVGNELVVDYWTVGGGRKTVRRQ